MRWAPRSTVACVIEQNQRYLCVEEIASGLQVINQPAGHLEQHETLIEAARREVLEETGWEVEVTDLLGLYVYQAPNGATYHRHCFIARPLEHHPEHPLDEGILRPLWLSYEELCLRSDLRSDMVLTCIEDYRAGRRFPLDYIREESTRPSR
ncbi:NUDIX hydrolase [Motiliproteus sediminis]|uniref:NUDIX hydrolase n=1 Tax=Motiliproteus sediminis TaxID=1468178 RepID=UPI001AEFFD77|nr:NUDIX hydrolase [Motiliproteus sediminis]